MMDYFIEASSKFNYKSFQTSPPPPPTVLNSVKKRKKVWFIFKGEAKIIHGNNMTKTNNPEKFKILKKKRKERTSKIWLELMVCDYTKHFFC